MTDRTEAPMPDMNERARSALSTLDDAVTDGHRAHLAITTAVPALLILARRLRVLNDTTSEALEEIASDLSDSIAGEGG